MADELTNNATQKKPTNALPRKRLADNFSKKNMTLVNILVKNVNNKSLNKTSVIMNNNNSANVNTNEIKIVHNTFGSYNEILSRKTCTREINP